MSFRDWWDRLNGRARQAAPVDVVLDKVPTEEDLLAALDATDASVAGGAVPAPVASRVRRITRTVRETLPEGFQRAEYLHERGIVDMVVKRGEMREMLGRIIGLLRVREVAPTPAPEPEEPPSGPPEQAAA